jgi:ribosomal protein S18 acetylase RimI-like enzyme
VVQESVVLRAAQPTLEEGRAYGSYLDELTPGFRYTLGRAAVDIIAHAYLQPNHGLSYEYVTFAEQDGSIIGVVAGYTAEQYAGFSDGALTDAARGRPLARVGAGLLTRTLRWMFGTHDEGDYYVWALAVSERCRNEGVGSEMMDFAEERAREAGSRRLTLDVDAANEGGRRFYERRGMEVVSSWRPFPVGNPAAVKMAKLL